MPPEPDQGVGLESRVQRLFFAQGLFAERGLYPSAGPDYSMRATDVDVLVSEYSSRFHLTRRHFECKGGKVQVLDRILWLNGLRSLLGADTSYLLLKSADRAIAMFGRTLNIELMAVDDLKTWEDAVSFPKDRWPARSDYQAFEVARKSWVKKYGNKRADGQWLKLKGALAFIEVDSWLDFRYSHVNKTLRLISELGESIPSLTADRDKRVCSLYVISALQVRLAQQLLAACHDITPVPRTEVKSYIAEKLTFGDHEPGQVSGIVRGTADWIRRGLDEAKMPMPDTVDINRLFTPPLYAEEFAELLHRLRAQSDAAGFLPIAFEMTQFENVGTLKAFPRLHAATREAESLVALVKGFLVRTQKVQMKTLNGVGDQIRTVYSSKPKEQTSEHSQLPLDNH